MSRILPIILLLISASAFGQTQLSGKVTDESGGPLPGVSVLLKTTSNGVVTDVDGQYQLSDLPDTGVIVFSFIGYTTQEISFNGTATLNVKLLPDATALEEVVVVGYGVQKKSVATASLSKVDSKDLAGFSVARADQMLQGQVSGVTFKSSSGQPGAGMNIFIRGVGTNGDNSPLIIIDGFVANDGLLQTLNPSDIESVEVLKDGASTAIYGARGANGIIIVTTKKAKAGNATLNYTSNYGSSAPWRLPQVLNAQQYVTLTREQFANDGRTPGAGFPDQTNIPNDTRWMDVIFQPGTIQNHQLSLSKGTETSTFYSSLSYFDQKGVIDPAKSSMQRITARLNSETKVNNFITMGENIFLIHSRRRIIPDGSAFGSPIGDALALDPFTAIYDSTRQYGFAQSKWVKNEIVNPLSRLFVNNNNNYQDGTTGNVYLKITPLKNLTFRSDIGFDYNIYTGNAFAPSYAFTPGFSLKSNSTSAYAVKKYRWQWENYINYSKTINSHYFDVTAGVTVQERYDNWDGGIGLSAGSNGVDYDVQLNPNYWYINQSPDSAQASSWKQERVALRSYFGRLNYNYNEKYLASFTLRRDASTVFGPNNAAGVFPSASVGWVVSKEDFFPLREIISFYKVRASYGINGNDRIGSLQYMSTVQRSGAYSFGKPYDQNVYNGLSSTYAANPGIKWEQSIQTDVGMEFGFLRDRFTLEVDYYNKTTSGLLMRATTLSMIGTDPPYANVGTVVNKGWEFEANYQQNVHGVGVRVGLTAATLKNQVTDVKGGGIQYGFGWPVRNVNITRMEVGKPIGYFVGRQTDGIFRSESDIFAYINKNGDPIQPNAKPGDLKFVDVNGDGKIDDNDMTNIGNPWPKLTMGLNLSLSYKGFDFRALLSGAFKYQVYRTYERGDLPYTNFRTTWLDRWSESNPNGKYPRLTYVDPNGNSKASSFFVEDASFVRLKNIQIGYSLPKSIASMLQLSSLRIYGSVDNLMTLTKYSGFDPEIGTQGGILETGVDKGFYPQMRAITAGINFTF